MCVSCWLSLFFGIGVCRWFYFVVVGGRCLLLLVFVVVWGCLLLFMFDTCCCGLWLDVVCSRLLL